MALLISCQDLMKTFGARPLFENIAFGISDDDRIGMIGPNGTGKSTLLKILAGLETPDHGEVSVSRNTRICYLPQEDIFNADHTISQILHAALKDQKLEDYEVETEVAIMISKVGFADENTKAGALSGGWRKRLAIARQLIQKPDLLLLDEPTNHLDLEGILWLEKLLKNSPFAFLAISHDRYFVEAISKRVIELNRRYPQGHFSAKGSYTDFLVQREEFFAGQIQQQESLANKVRREVEWLRRGPKARTTKANSRIKEAHQLIGDLDELAYRNAQTAKVKIDFTASDRKTKKLITAKHLNKSLGGKPLFNDVTLTLSPGIRLGLLGLNGSGKTTLLKTLLGKIEPDSGTIERADHLKVVFFDQAREQLDNTMTLRRALTPYGDQVIYRDQTIHVTTWARKFLFQTDQLETPIKDLSGGERARILIARLMQQPADVLMLDEPTNDLDIPTLEVLEESLLDFPGALVLVTHDRYMLDRISTHLLALDGAGGTEFFADYSQWETAEAAKAKAVEKAQPSKSAPAKMGKKLSYKEQRELDSIEADVLKAEETVAACQAQMSEPAIIADAAKLQAACVRIKEAQDIVDALYQRWAKLEAKQYS